MAIKQITPPFPIIPDLDGTALENGYVYIGSAGLNPETNAITVYWDIKLTIPIVQPIRTINGFFSNNGTPGNIFTDTSPYSILVKNKNLELVYMELTKYQEVAVYGINVKDFGAIGNGIVDDTAAIQAAIDSLGTVGGVVYIPTGTYLITIPIDIGEGITLKGEGENNSFLTCSSSFVGSSGLTITNAFTKGAAVEDLGIDCNSSVANGISSLDVKPLTLNRVLVKDSTDDGYIIRTTNQLIITNCKGVSCAGDVFYLEASAALDGAATIQGIEGTISNCRAEGCDAVIRTNQVDTSNINIIMNQFKEVSNAGSYSIASSGVHLDHILKLIDCEFGSAISGVAIVYHATNVIRTPGISCTGGANPIFNLDSLFEGLDYYSGLVQIIATLNEYDSSAGDGKLASYLLLVTRGGAIATRVVTLIAKNGLTSGAAADEPSFTWAISSPGGQLVNAVVGSTSGTFYFYATQLGGVKLTNV